MPNIAAVLKEEISRLARKELRGEVRIIRKSSAQYRRTIAAMKRKIATFEREIASLKKRGVAAASRAAAASTGAHASAAGEGEGDRKVRFSAKGLRSNRERLGLSAEDYGKLVGVTGQSIYNWERGTAQPRNAQRGTLAELRGLGKKEVRARLEALGAAPAKQPRKRASRKAKA